MTSEESFGIWISEERIKENIENGGIDPLFYILQANDIQNNILDALEEGSDSGKYELVRLGDLFERRKDKIGKRGDKIVYGIFAENIDRALGKITEVEKKEFGSYTKCEPGDILYYRMRPYLRKTAIIPDKMKLRYRSDNL